MTEHAPEGGAVATTSGTLAIRPGQDSWDTRQLAALQQLGVENAPPGDLAVFLHYAQRTGLDPFARQLYMIKRRQRVNGQMEDRWTIQAGIDALRIVAQRSHQYGGQVGPEWCGPDGKWRDVWLETTPPRACRVGVLRQGFSQPLYAVAHWDEYAAKFERNGQQQLQGLWATKPAVMIAKCAEALALRKAFPMDLSGIYTAEEMAQSDTPALTPAQQVGGNAPAETVCTAEPMEVLRLRRDVLDVALLDNATEALTALWHEAKAASALACDVAVPEPWQAIPAPDGTTTPAALPLSALIILARAAGQQGIDPGREDDSAEVHDAEVVPESMPNGGAATDDAEPCPATRKRDGAQCAYLLGHTGRHDYAEPADLVTEPTCGQASAEAGEVNTDGSGWPCTRPVGHDGDHDSTRTD